MSGADPRAIESVARAGREAMRQVWRRRDERETLSVAEAALLELLEQHKEFRAFWEGAEPTQDDNPFIHITLHQMIDKQLKDDEPAGTRATLDRLVASGLDGHEARHKLMSLWAVELFGSLRAGKPLDLVGYREKLDALS